MIIKIESKMIKLPLQFNDKLISIFIIVIFWVFHTIFVLKLTEKMCRTISYSCQIKISNIDNLNLFDIISKYFEKICLKIREYITTENNLCKILNFYCNIRWKETNYI